jgi:hypothetical protein
MTIQLSKEEFELVQDLLRILDGYSEYDVSEAGARITEQDTIRILRLAEELRRALR